MSEKDFLNRNKFELKSICNNNWKAITFFEIKITELRKNAFYIKVGKPVYKQLLLKSIVLLIHVYQVNPLRFYT